MANKLANAINGVGNAAMQIPALPGAVLGGAASAFASAANEAVGGVSRITNSRTDYGVPKPGDVAAGVIQYAVATVTAIPRGIIGGVKGGLSTIETAFNNLGRVGK